MHYHSMPRIYHSLDGVYHWIQIAWYNTILYMHRSYPGIRLLYPPHVGLADTEDWSCHHLACWTATCPRDVITRKTVDSIMSFPDQTSSSSRPDIIKRPDIMIWPEIITRKTLDSIMPGQKSSCMNLSPKVGSKWSTANFTDFTVCRLNHIVQMVLVDLINPNILESYGTFSQN